MKYHGYSCPVCQKAFEPNDDIVVCPICGAPHHRECYREFGSCALTKNHEQGIPWEQTVAPATPPPPSDFTSDATHASAENEPPRAQRNTNGPSQPLRCSGCGSSNPPDGVFCQVCGTMLGQHRSPPGGHVHRPSYTPPGQGYDNQPYGQPHNQQSYQQQQQQYQQQPPHGYYQAYSPYAGLNPEDTIGSCSVKEITTYVGAASHHYLPRFSALSKGSILASFSWSAFIFNFLFFFYRKVYTVAIPLLILFLLGLVPTFVYSYEYMREIMVQYGSISFPLPVIETATLDNMYVVMNAVRMIHLGVSAAIGFWGHRIYLWDINRKISALRRDMGQTPDPSHYIHRLSQKGGVSSVSVAAIATALTVGYFVVSFIIGTSLNITM